MCLNHLHQLKRRSSLLVRVQRQYGWKDTGNGLVDNTFGFPVTGQRVLEEFGLKGTGRKHPVAGCGKKDIGVGEG
jgi:hypothetical protein